MHMSHIRSDAYHNPNISAAVEPHTIIRHQNSLLENVNISGKQTQNA